MRNSRIYNIDMVRGDTLSFGFEVDGIDNLDTAFFTCKRNADDSEYLFQKRFGFGIYKDSNGKYGVRIAPEDTQSIDPGLYYYDVEIGVNNDIFTILEGRLKIVQDITAKTDRHETVVKWGNIIGDLSNQEDLQTSLNEKANTEDLSDVATSGSYNDLLNKPSIPTKTSELTNDSDFIVGTDLSAVATSGSYVDLTNTPNLATVAITGSYNDLSNTPNLASVATSGLVTDLTGVLPLTNGGTGATNASDARENLGLKEVVLYDNADGTYILRNLFDVANLSDAVKVGFLYKFKGSKIDDYYNGFQYKIFPVYDTRTVFSFIAFATSFADSSLFCANHKFSLGKDYLYTLVNTGLKFYPNSSGNIVVTSSFANEAQLNFFKIVKYTF